MSYGGFHGVVSTEKAAESSRFGRTLHEISVLMFFSSLMAVVAVARA